VLGEYSNKVTCGASLSIQLTVATALHVFPALSLNSHVQFPFSPNTTTVAFPPDKGEGAEGGRGFVKENPLVISTSALLKLMVATTSHEVAPVSSYVISQTIGFIGAFLKQRTAKPLVASTAP
jgi:hypothetical protein